MHINLPPNRAVFEEGGEAEVTSQQSFVILLRYKRFSSYCKPTHTQKNPRLLTNSKCYSNLLLNYVYNERFDLMKTQLVMLYFNLYQLKI